VIIFCLLPSCSQKTSPAVGDSQARLAAADALSDAPLEFPEKEPSEPLAAISEAALSESPELPKPTAAFVSTPESRQDLAWKFAPGDILRYDLHLSETSSRGQKELKNERAMRLRWEVFDVDSSGVASMLATFDRVRLSLEDPSLQFDSHDAAPDSEADASQSQPIEIIVAKNILRSRMLLTVTPRGACTWKFDDGTPSSGLPCRPDDFPLLFDEPVGLGDSWPAKSQEGSAVSTQFTIHRYKQEETVAGRNIAVIESQFEGAGEFTLGSGLSPSHATVSRFDWRTGRFLSRVSKVISTKQTDGEEWISRLEVRQQLLLPSAAVVDQYKRTPRGPVER